MTYNVENLFDTKDDPRTEDETFLPLDQKKGPDHKKACKKSASFGGRLWDCQFLDWNEATLDKKMKNLADVILKAPGGKGPDILILAEVENIGVLNELNNKYLAKAGYKIHHMNSHDERGIDQAILSRFPLHKDSYRYHTMELSRFDKKQKKVVKKELRGVLQTLFDVNGKILNVFALHLPSQGSRFEEREAMLKKLNQLAMAVPANEIVVAGGDFNVTSKEWERKNVYSHYLEPIWKLAHLEGCKQCLGTYYYKTNKEWSFFDWLMLRVDRENKARWHWDTASVQLIKDPKQEKPQRFDPNTKEGASDHFPLYGELVIE